MTLQHLRKVLKYDPNTGVFTWTAKAHRVRHVNVDGCAGSVHRRSGYRYILVEGTRYKASRLAWFYTYGIWPPQQLDHINGRRSDDRIANLREATAGENNQNHRFHKNNTSGARGVIAHGNRWRAQIRVNKRTRHIGVFDSLEEASQAYLAARADVFTFQPVPREA